MATLGYTGLASTGYLEYPVYEIQHRKYRAFLASLVYIAIIQYTVLYNNNICAFSENGQY